MMQTDRLAFTYERMDGRRYRSADWTFARPWWPLVAVRWCRARRLGFRVSSLSVNYIDVSPLQLERLDMWIEAKAGHGTQGSFFRWSLESDPWEIRRIILDMVLRVSDQGPGAK